MTSFNDPNIQCERLSRHAPQVRKVRDFVAGENAVKEAGDLYMPVPSVGMDPTGDSFKSFLKRTAFFPAAARVLDGCVSLVFQKDPVLDSPTVGLIKNTITHDMESLELFAERLISETLQTNYTGVLVDAPADRPPNLNGSNALELGFHPFLTLYPFESILDHKVGRGIGGQQVWNYVKLSDGCDGYRELRLENGIYTVTLHRREAGATEYQTRKLTPLRDGKPLDFIPFKLVTTKDKDRWPHKSLLDDVVNVNCNHYITSGELSSALFNCAGPQKIVTNPAQQTDDNGVVLPNSYPAGSDHVWEIHGENASVQFLEFTGAGVAEIRQQLVELKSQMSALGSRILQDEKAAPEAAEALAIRQTSQNAAIITVTNSVSKQLEVVLRWLAWWMGAARKDDPETRFTLNADLVPSKLTPEEVTTIQGLKASRDYTDEEAFYALRDGGWHADTLTWEVHKAALDAQRIDDPLVLPSSGFADGAE